MNYSNTIIAKQFEKAASQYDSAAHLQRAIAKRLIKFLCMTFLIVLKYSWNGTKWGTLIASLKIIVQCYRDTNIKYMIL